MSNAQTPTNASRTDSETDDGSEEQPHVVMVFLHDLGKEEHGRPLDVFTDDNVCESEHAAEQRANDILTNPREEVTADLNDDQDVWVTVERHSPGQSPSL